MATKSLPTLHGFIQLQNDQFLETQNAK